jgi:hypothetical protein
MALGLIEDAAIPSSSPLSFIRLLDQLDPDPHKRGRKSARLCRWYLRTAPWLTA